jgi:regulator of protease activity HflC (stomatin/prohibitin superfamily)
MRAEREKRATVLTSRASGRRHQQSRGRKQQVIKASEARKQQQINEAEGQGSAILTSLSDLGRDPAWLKRLKLRRL